MSDNDNQIIFGIDLGTRFSCLSIWKNKRLEIIPDQFGNRTIPSVVAFYRSVKLVGHNALSLKEIRPGNTIYDIKRIIGRRFDDPSIEQTKQIVSYEIIDDESFHHNVLVKLDENDTQLARKITYRPEEICSYILSEIKKMGCNYLKIKEDNIKAVITVPVYFNDSQRQATLDAAKIAGLDVIKMINEPTAAALTYGLGNKSKRNIIVYDLGAGTLDVSLMHIEDGIFKTLAVSGNTHLGGEDIDYLIMNQILIDFQKQHKIKDLKLSKLSQLKLKNSVENAKKIISTADKSTICVDNFYMNEKLYYVLTRNLFETFCNGFFIMCIKYLDEVINNSELTKYDIDEVILVGGSTRIPKLQKLILEYFKDSKDSTDLRKSKIERLTTSLNPDEVVSSGAAIYGYISTHGDDPFSNDIVLLDITPLSLGIETLQKQMTVIIPRNTVIPTKKIKIFSTDTDYQDNVSIKIFEGERKLTKHNFHVGTFDLTGFQKGPRGFPTIKITFHIDVNGILQVIAHEKKSNIQNSIQITSTWGAKGRLSKKDIDNIISEANFNEQFDQLFSLKINLVYQINSICNAILMNLKDDAFNLTNLDKKKIKMDVRSNLKLLKDKELADLNVDELKKHEERLSKMYSPLIAQVDNKNNEFKDTCVKSQTAEIHGDDENDNSSIFEIIKIPDDPSEFDKEEIKALKKTIFDLGKNIISVINNPVSNFNNNDIMYMTDYIETVNIWLYTTNVSTSVEFVAKIDEINKVTEEMMKKYEDKKIFENNINFSNRDELHLTCLTLNKSIQSKYFSIKDEDNEKLMNLINSTMIWLMIHANEEQLIYKDKLNEFIDMCNLIYHNPHKIKILENIKLCKENEESDQEDDETEQKISENNHIQENIDHLINNLPNKSTRIERISKDSSENEKAVLLKMDVDRLCHNATLNFKNIEYSYR